MPTTIRYGKANVACYRTYAQPLAGLAPIPESAFTGRENILFATDVDVEVYGDNFMPAYTEGDNSNVVPTDTMKNFILRMGAKYEGATHEGFLYFLGEQFLATYPQMQTLRLIGREIPFAAASVSQNDGFAASPTLFSRTRDDHAIASFDITRAGDAVQITDHRCGQVDLQLIKITGSSFAQFPRDSYTTLPEMKDRPLFIYLDMFWRYADPSHATGADLSQYVAAEQVRDLAQVVFHEFVSKSIQHLVYEMGRRILDRFPQLAEVSFEAQNRLWDTAHISATDERIKVYCDPRPPYGSIGLTLTRD
jgi:urate oxidase